MRFMGGAAVFPGGAVSAADLDPRWEQASGRSRGAAAEGLGSDDGVAALGAFVCALREAFEEVGFLLGTGPLEDIDRRAAGDAPAWLAECLRLGVVLATDALVPIGRWVTPLGSPVRFDAWFFAVRVPDGWEPVPDPGEVEHVMWLTPRAALDELATGGLHMGPPTIETLQRMEGAGSVEEVLALLESGHGRLGATRIHRAVQLVLAPNPGPMTGPGTNTYIVGLPGAPSCVIDPAVDDTDYLEAVAAAAGDVERIIVTHRHPDHIGGLAPIVERTGAPVHAFGTEAIEGVPIDTVEDGRVIEVGGVVLRVLHTPGHASDHICLLLDDMLFTGDCVLGEGTAVIAPPDGDMRAYMATLKRLRELPVTRLFPGHFRPRDDAIGLIEEYIDHRQQREQEIVDALGAGATVEEVVARVYTDTPAALHGLAAFTVLAQLEMAEEDGRVERRGDRWTVRR
jgi:glyoxylase-like metal-dependent hydrolase (beta-lactamase superfamily II)/8-oxo-dGTP pyrophosphatase MutT (NUDIX family)